MWNKMKRTIYILLNVLLLLGACQDEDVWVNNDVNERIYLGAMIEQPVQSRVPYTLTAPTKDNPLNVAVWASTTLNRYEDKDLIGKSLSGPTDVAYHTSATFTNGVEQLLNDAVYPNTTDKETPVYFIGMHPSEGWTDTNGLTASNTFDGKTDVMFASQISGSYGNNVETKSWPTFTFKHLLTWLRIEMIAESEAIRDAWGSLEVLTIKSPNGVEIDFSMGDRFDASKVTFTGETDMKFYKTGTDDEFPGTNGVALPAPPPGEEDNVSSYVKELAYVLCAPVEATEKEDEKKTTEYTLSLKTKNRSVTVPIDLMKAEGQHYTGTTMGHQFTILLNFKMGDDISVMAKVSDWSTGGIGSGELNE